MTKVSKSSNGKAKVIVVSVLVLILAAAVIITCGIGSRDTVTGQWFRIGDVTKWFHSWGKDKNDHVEDNIRIMAYSLQPEEYAAYGVSETSLKAGVLTADFQPYNTSDKRTNWRWHWAGNSWSANKVLTDYVDFTPAENSAPKLTYSVKQPFGDRIVVECSSVVSPTLTGATSFEYVARYSAIFDWGAGTIENGGSVDVLADLYTAECYSVVPDKMIAREVRFDYTDSFENYVNTNFPNDAFGYETHKTFQVVNSPITWEELEMDNLKDYIASYYLATGSTDVFEVYTTIDCYYGDKLMYTFSDNETLEFGSTINELVVPPTGITSNPGTVIV